MEPRYSLKMYLVALAPQSPIPAYAPPNCYAPEYGPRNDQGQGCGLAANGFRSLR